MVICARDWIRTSTSLRTLRPEHSASTNFATRAFESKLKIKNKINLYSIQDFYALTLKSLKASFKLVFLSVLSFLFPIINAQLTLYSPAGNFFI